MPSRTVAQRPTSSTPRSASALRSSVARSGVPTSCGEGSRRARVRSSTSSYRSSHRPDAFHPPQHVAAAIGTRHPDVLADRERHRPARSRQLGGQLYARRRRSDHEDPAVGKLRRDCGSRRASTE